MEKSIIASAAATAVLALAPDQQDARARAPYEAPALQAVELGAVFAGGENYVGPSEEEDNDYDSSNVFGQE